MAREITGIKRASYAPDFSKLEIEFLTKGIPLTAEMTTSNLDRVINKLAELLRFIRSQTLSKGDHFEVHTSAVVDGTASAPAGGGPVVLALVGDNGVVQNFAIPAELSARLRKEMEAAEQKTAAEAKQTRQ